MINGEKGDNDRSLVCVGVVLLVVTVASHLTLFKTLCTVEHNEYDANVGDNCGYPMTDTCVAACTAYEHAGPEDDLTEIVGTTAHLVEALGSNHVGSFLLLCGLLIVCNSLEDNTCDRDNEADDGNDKIIFRAVSYAEEHGRNLRGVKANVIDCPDFAQFIVDTMDETNVTYNVGGKETYTYEEMAQMCFDAAKKPLKIKWAPIWLFGILANLPKIKKAGKHDIILFSKWTLSHDLVGDTETGDGSFAEYIKSYFGKEA